MSTVLAGPGVPVGADWSAEIERLRSEARGCTNCPLFENATQTVFGEGMVGGLMLVGEQPGNEEDLEGHPFVGPAGRILDDALRAAEIDRDATYITNAVKHFKWEPRGKRRIHQRPTRREIRACLPWLESEVRVIQPRVLVCLGATAASTVFGSDFRLTDHRGEQLASDLAPITFVTLHPSAVLRQRDSLAAMEGLVGDLRRVAEVLKAPR